MHKIRYRNIVIYRRVKLLNMIFSGVWKGSKLRKHQVTVPRVSCAVDSVTKHLVIWIMMFFSVLGSHKYMF